MNAHPDFGGGFNDRFCLHVGLARVNVEHVVRRRAARQKHLRHRNLRADLHSVEIEPLPHFVQTEQPVKELRILHWFQAAGQGLVKMMVRVDEARNDRAAGGVDRFVRRETFRHNRHNVADAIVLDQDMMRLKLLNAVVSVPTDDMSVLDK